MKKFSLKVLSVILSILMLASFATGAFAEESQENAITSAILSALQGVFGEDADLSGLEEVLNSEITAELIEGATSAEGVVDLTQIVINLIATFNKDDLEAYGKEAVIELEQQLINTLAGIIKGIYDNRNLIIKFDQSVFFDWLGMDNEDNWKDPDGPDILNPDHEVYYMDVNGDGRVTAEDARLILRYSASLEEFDRDQRKRADANADGAVDAADARLALRFSAHLIFSKDIPAMQ